MTGIIKPKQRRYKKHCNKCGKNFRCDGVCGKSENMKVSHDSCYCGECYLKYISQTPDKWEKCSIRFGEKEQKEKVIFT